MPQLETLRDLLAEKGAKLRDKQVELNEIFDQRNSLRLELAEKQGEIERLRWALRTITRRDDYWRRENEGRERLFIDLANSLPRNQPPAPRPWWKRVWFKSERRGEDFKK